MLPTDPKELRAWAKKLLEELNEDAPLETIQRYLDAFVDYRTAQNNITEHGTIVIHPRTGAPIENPYLKIRAAAAAAMDKCKLETDELWADQ